MYFYKNIMIFLFFVKNECLAGKTHFSKWIKMDTENSWKVYVFETILGEGLDNCMEHCNAKKMCRYVNFNVRAGACFLISVSSNLDYSLDDRIQTKRGYALGKKEDWNLKNYDTCTECEPYGVCKQDNQSADQYTTCENSGCGLPENKRFTVVHGNMFSVGNTIEYQCQEDYIDFSGDTGIATCQDSGIWSSSAIKCEPSNNALANMTNAVALTCFMNSCYQLYKSNLNWHDGKIYCESLGGHLADIETELEHEFVKENIFYREETERAWLGANNEDNEETFVWSDGTRVDDGYTAWGKRQPNNAAYEHCVPYQVTKDGERQYYWHDFACSRMFWCLCEI